MAEPKDPRMAGWLRLWESHAGVARRLTPGKKALGHPGLTRLERTALSRIAEAHSAARAALAPRLFPASALGFPPCLRLSPARLASLSLCLLLNPFAAGAAVAPPRKGAASAEAPSPQPGGASVGGLRGRGRLGKAARGLGGQSCKRGPGAFPLAQVFQQGGKESAGLFPKGDALPAFLEGRKAARRGVRELQARLLGETERRRKGCRWRDAAQDEGELTQEVHVSGGDTLMGRSQNNLECGTKLNQVSQIQKRPHP